MGRRKDCDILSRRFILNERDELAFCRALRERFPSILFMEDRRYESADIPLSESYPMQDWGAVWALIPTQSDWKPFCLPEGNGVWPVNFPRSHVAITRSFWQWPRPAHWAGDPPFLMMGHMYQSIRKGTGEDLRANVRDVFRCLGKVTRRFHGKCFGYDALRWASEAPRRTLDGWFIPPADYKFPVKNRYYQDELWDDRLPEAPTLPTRGRPYDLEAFKRGEPV